MPWLVALDGPLAGRRFPLTATCLIGRGPYNHVVLEDVRASRQHAKISPESGNYVVHDLQSANGTFRNSMLVQYCQLAANDILRFGSTSFRFELESDSKRIPLRTRPREEATTLDLLGDRILDQLPAPSLTPIRFPSPSYGLTEMEDADRKLRVLYGFMQAISSTFDAYELLERVVRNLFDIFPIARTVAVYLRNSAGKMVLRMARAREEARTNDDRPTPDLSAGQITFKRPRSEVLSGGLQMQAPMIYRDVVQGVLEVRAVRPDGFSRDDLALLNGLAAHSALGLENIRMHEEASKQLRVQRDLVLAERIQKSFLPRTLPELEGIEFVTEYRPAYTIGGDFYDVFWVGAERIGVFIGDVSGKGIAAALLMARVTSDLRFAAISQSEPGHVLSSVNRVVLSRQQHDIFVTAVFCTIDLRTREVVVANAGHPPPLVRRGQAGRVETIDQGVGPPIGVFEDAVYEHVRFRLHHGDLIVLCTDGIIEAADKKGRQFGYDRLVASVKRGGFRGANVAARLLSELKAFASDSEDLDDLTLLICGVVDEGEVAFDDQRDDKTPVG